MRQTMKRPPPKINNREMARLYAVRYGYDDPAAAEFRRRARWAARRELAGEVLTVAVWVAGAIAWLAFSMGGEL